MISRINATFVFEFAFSCGQGYYYYPLVSSVLETDRRLASQSSGDKRSVPELKPPPGGEKERTAKTGSGFQPRSGLFLFYKNRKKGAWKE